MSGADYGKLRAREVKRNPDQVARELEQASQWSLREAERKLKENSHRWKEKKISG
jgi:hypothetical protein